MSSSQVKTGAHQQPIVVIQRDHRLHYFWLIAVLFCCSSLSACGSTLSQSLTLNNSDRLAANGIQKFSGKHLSLFTDSRGADVAAQATDLVNAFDEAVSQWCDHFNIDPAGAADWRVNAFVMVEGDRFRAAGMFPDDLPKFPAGYQRGKNIWIYQQPGDYYTRHLLLHEGTHGFMNEFLGSIGPPWYAEGMAEMLALHSWKTNERQEPELQLNARIRDRNQSAHWGRIKLLRTAYAENQRLTLDEVLVAVDFRDVKKYAWAWAACKFFSQHPLSKTEFANLPKQVNQPGQKFNTAFKHSLADHWPTLERDWQLMLGEIDYGYEFSRGVLIPAKTLSQTANQTKIEIRSDHAWQTTSIHVDQGDRIRIRSASRFQVANKVPPSGGQAEPWPCEPNGITIEYYRGKPLGILLAGVLADLDSDTNIKNSILHLESPQTIGYDSAIEIEESGILCLRINESPAHLDDNQGTLQVSVEKLK